MQNLNAAQPFSQQHFNSVEHQTAASAQSQNSQQSSIFMPTMSSSNNRQQFTYDEQVRLTKEPFHFLMKNTQGKEIRSKLIDAFNIWLNASDETQQVVRTVTQKLHNASLLIDDIEDNSKLRRGKPCAHLIYGVPATINCANYVYFEALKDLQQLQCIEAINVYMDELLNLHRGQAMDIYWRDNNVCPTEEEYMEMVQNKTGGLFRLAVGLMQSKSANKSDFSPLVNKLASLFQILDDYLNLESPKYHTNKSFAEDLTEGKFSFPIIHSIQASKFADSRLLNIVRQKPSDHNVKTYAIEIMRETQSFAYTIAALRQLEKEVYEHIDLLGSNDSLKSIIKALMSEIDAISSAKQ